MPHPRTRKQAIPVADLALVAHLRRDVMLPVLRAIERLGSQSTFTRFFQGITSAGKNLATFRPLWRWCLERLRSRQGGYALDLDSTRLLHEDGHQECVATGYTRLGTKPCLHPLLAVLEKANLVVGLWLRPGNAACANNVVAFTLDLLANFPKWIGLRLVRSDSGFCVPEWLDLLERLKLQYIVVAWLLKPLQRLLKKDLIWTATNVPGTEVTEVWHQEVNWPAPRRVILLRHRIADKQTAGQRTGGKGLVDCPGYLDQTSCSMDKTGKLWETAHHPPGLLASDDFRAGW
ncbi:MAG: transposase [Verrucomicrobiae bacterium]|nr:transposase [Verrucomicrobiae bacterium]